jgi:nicotinamidase-related amidase
MVAFPPELPLPPHFRPNRVGEVWRVPYQSLADAALQWSQQHALLAVGRDRFKVALIAIDVQNTFCLPEFELFVAGRSGKGALDDTRRLCEFIYRYLGVLTHIIPTMDTHQAMQIFHPVYLVDDKGQHPDPLTLVTHEDVLKGKWKFNPDIAASLGIDAAYGQKHLQHYTQVLKSQGKYDLTIWPYHAMLGGIGHALVPLFEEALFFHTIARRAQPEIEIKGQLAATESYSAIGPEVLDGPEGEEIARKNPRFLEIVKSYDAVLIAGEAKSHCVAWTVDDLLVQINQDDPALAQRIYLLEDCTSPVVVPGVVDYSEPADAAFQRFAQAGMHLVRSTDPIQDWLKIR